MVDNVTLTEPGLASAGNPNFMPGFGDGLRSLGRSLERVGEAFKPADQGEAALSELQNTLFSEAQRIQVQGDTQANLTAARTRAQSAVKKAILAGADPTKSGSLFRTAFQPGGAISEVTPVAQEFEQAQAKALVDQTLDTMKKVAPNLINIPLKQQRQIVDSFLEQQARTARAVADYEEIKADEDLKGIKLESAQKDLKRKMASGGVLGVTTDINTIVGDVTFNSAPDAVTEKIAELEEYKAGRLSFIQNTFTELDNSAEVSLVNQTVDAAIASLSNAEGAKQWQNNNTIALEMARRDLFAKPGVTDVKVTWDIINLLPKDIMTGSEREATGRLLARDVATLYNLTTLVDKPDASLSTSGEVEGETDLEVREKTVETYKGAKKFYSDPTVTKAIKADSVAALEAVKPLTVMTRDMATQGKQVPAAAYDQVFSMISSDLDTFRALLVTEHGPELIQNLSEGMRSYTDTLTESLANDLDKELNDRMPVEFFRELPEAPKPTELKIGGFTLLSISNELPIPEEVLQRESFFPKTSNVVNMKLKEDGSIGFSPRKGLESNPMAVAKANELNKKYSNRFGQIVRTHAHVNNNNKDYRSAQADIVIDDRLFSNIFQVTSEGELEARRTPETILEQKQTGEFEQKVEQVIPTPDDAVEATNRSIDPAELQQIIKEGDRDQVIQYFKDRGVDVSDAEGLRILPDLTMSDEQVKKAQFLEAKKEFPNLTDEEIREVLA